MIDQFSFFNKKIGYNKQFTFHVSLTFTYISVFIAFTALFVSAYLYWELYWYYHVGLAFIKWHTHLMPYIVLGLLLFIYIVRHPAVSKTSMNMYLLLSSIIFSLFTLEAVLTISGITKTYMEKVSGYYASPYSSLDRGWYHIWLHPGTAHWLTKPEYSYWRPTNSLGFGDPEWRTARKPKEKRILALGDSFTEGDGAAYDSSFVSVMRRELLMSGDSFYVMNAGVCGSDPFNNYINYRDLLQPYSPDVIIQSFGSGDMTTDILLRGGMERFQKDGRARYTPAPWWEPVYALSYTSRVFFKLAGYDELLRKKTISPDVNARMVKSVESLFSTYAALCRANGTKLIIVLHPEHEEIEKNKYNYDFAPILQYLAADSRIKVVDLLPSYQKYIKQSNTSSNDYFWKIDGHHNGKGYTMMAETILENIRPYLSDSVSAKTDTPQ